MLPIKLLLYIFPQTDTLKEKFKYLLIYSLLSHNIIFESNMYEDNVLDNDDIKELDLNKEKDDFGR